jgi:hypothetical protein
MERSSSMQLMPAAGEPGREPRLVARAGRSQQRAELEVFEYGLRAAVGAQKDMLDSEALGDVMTCALKEELDFLDYVIARANGSAAGLELGTRMAELMSKINNRRISRRFGG